MERAVEERVINPSSLEQSWSMFFPVIGNEISITVVFHIHVSISFINYTAPQSVQQHGGGRGVQPLKRLTRMVNYFLS